MSLGVWVAGWSDRYGPKEMLFKVRRRLPIGTRVTRSRKGNIVPWRRPKQEVLGRVARYVNLEKEMAAIKAEADREQTRLAELYPCCFEKPGLERT